MDLVFPFQSNKSTRQWMYSDFFDDPGAETAKSTKQKKRVQFDEDEEEEEEEMDEEGNEEGDDKDFEEQRYTF